METWAPVHLPMCAPGGTPLHTWFSLLCSHVRLLPSARMSSELCLAAVLSGHCCYVRIRGTAFAEGELDRVHAPIGSLTGLAMCHHFNTYQRCLRAEHRMNGYMRECAVVVFVVNVGGSMTMMKALRKAVDACRSSFGHALRNLPAHHMSTGGHPAEDNVNLILDKGSTGDKQEPTIALGGQWRRTASMRPRGESFVLAGMGQKKGSVLVHAENRPELCSHWQTCMRRLRCVVVLRNNCC